MASQNLYKIAKKATRKSQKQENQKHLHLFSLLSSFNFSFKFAGVKRLRVVTYIVFIANGILGWVMLSNVYSIVGELSFSSKLMSVSYETYYRVALLCMWWLIGLGAVMLTLEFTHKGGDNASVFKEPLSVQTENQTPLETKQIEPESAEFEPMVVVDVKEYSLFEKEEKDEI
ncbi:MAG: hypothetical protein ABSA75_02315 [Candidatus Bathyarchaeia archaeon]|jgi:hypothetical protein